MLSKFKSETKLINVIIHKVKTINCSNFSSFLIQKLFFFSSSFFSSKFLGRVVELVIIENVFLKSHVVLRICHQERNELLKNLMYCI